MRTMKFPGKMLGLGTFINSDLDAKRRVVYFTEMAWTGGNYDRTMTQAVTRMATIECVIIGRNQADDKGSASTLYSVGTLSNGTVKFHNRCFVSGAACTNKRATKMSIWMVGTPDPQRIVI
jgi:hypothetical protein